MIEKIFIQSICLSCGKDTPVIFIVKDLVGEPLFKIPLCRECSNKFAEDVINTLRGKLDKSHQIIGSKRGEIIQLKCKVKDMNVRSHLHKEKITELLNEKKGE